MNVTKQCWFCQKNKTLEELMLDKLDGEYICKECDKTIFPDNLNEAVKEKKRLEKDRYKKLTSIVLKLFYTLKNNEVPTIQRNLRNKGIEVEIHTINTMIDKSLREKFNKISKICKS